LLELELANFLELETAHASKTSIFSPEHSEQGTVQSTDTVARHAVTLDRTARERGVSQIRTALASLLAVAVIFGEISKRSASLLYAMDPYPSYLSVLAYV
jgi:hypothetical protein